MSDPRLLTPEAAAERLSCSARSIRYAITSGRLPAAVVVDANERVVTYGISLDDLARWRPAPRGRPRKPS